MSYQDVSVREFGFDVDQTLPGLMKTTDEQLHRFIPNQLPHVFPKRDFICFRAWLQLGQGEPIYIMGPQGCGKTTFVRQFAARLNYPMIEITGRSTMEKSDLIGSFVLKTDGAMHWVDGPAVRAWRHGMILLINEFTACDPAFWVANNEILEGADIMIEQTGELVRRHPNARIVITDNTKGLVGDETGMFQGRLRQDASVMDRVWKMSMNYMPAEQEIALLIRGMPEMGDDALVSADLKKRFAEKLRSVAEQVRQAYMGFNPDNDSIEATLSTRTLIRVRDLLIAFKDGTRYGFDPVEDAFDMALTAACDPTTRQVILSIAQLTLGGQGNQRGTV